MVLILGGTTEGRLAVRVTEGAGSPYWYSTRGELQQIECKNGTHITGALDETAMAVFCVAHGIRLLIDAAHPFATELHRTVASVAESLDLPVVRVERVYSDRASLRWCEDYPDAIRQLETDGITRLLALTGVQTIGRLRPYWSRHNCWFRILHREESLEKAAGEGFPKERLVFYEEEDDASLIARLQPQAILTKESGESGGFNEKVEAAQAAGIPVYVVRRPPLPAGFETVTGEHGLRKAIERLAPGFFPLRSGFTTGACATAASKAALLALLGQPTGETVEVVFPDGECLPLPVSSCHLNYRPDADQSLIPQSDAAFRRAAEPFLTQRGRVGQQEPAAPPGQPKQRPIVESATATVVKDAGDDPDVTNGQEIVATVAFSDEPGIHFLQGEGVGRVTLPGLGLPIGGPAINRVPRQMMEQNLSALYDGGLDVTISVPGGRELARRTFNPKLGIVDGISIIGTSGIVRPFSNEAFVDAIRREIEVAMAVGAPRLVINSGAKSEAFLKARFPDLPPQAFVHYGNFIGETLKIAADLKVPQVTMGIMLGKAVKLAEGHLDTHSKSVVMNKAFLKEVATAAGCSSATAEAIDRLTLARELWHGLPATDAQHFFSAVLARCYTTCTSIYPGNGPDTMPGSAKESLAILLLDEDGNLFE